jgi:hypothetical protein
VQITHGTGRTGITISKGKSLCMATGTGTGIVYRQTVIIKKITAQFPFMTGIYIGKIQVNSIRNRGRQPFCKIIWSGCNACTSVQHNYNGHTGDQYACLLTAAFKPAFCMKPEFHF